MCFLQGFRRAKHHKMSYETKSLIAEMFGKINAGVLDDPQFDNDAQSSASERCVSEPPRQRTKLNFTRQKFTGHLLRTSRGGDGGHLCVTFRPAQYRKRLNSKRYIIWNYDPQDSDHNRGAFKLSA